MCLIYFIYGTYTHTEPFCESVYAKIVRKISVVNMGKWRMETRRMKNEKNKTLNTIFFRLVMYRWNGVGVDYIHSHRHGNQLMSNENYIRCLTLSNERKNKFCVLSYAALDEHFFFSFSFGWWSTNSNKKRRSKICKLFFHTTTLPET